MADQFSLFRTTFRRLVAFPGWHRLPLPQRADLMRATWKRDFMRSRPASHWTDFAAWSTDDWARVIQRLSM